MPESKGRSVDKIMKNSTKSKLDSFYSKSVEDFRYFLNKSTVISQ